MNTRTCTKCNKTFPATIEFFRAEKRTKVGLQSICKICQNKYNSEYNKNQENKNRHRINQSIWAKNNPDKIKNSAKKWANNNIEKVREYKRASYHRNPDHQKEKSKQWYYANYEKATERNKIYNKEFRKTHAEYYRSKCRNRRASINNSIGTHSDKDIEIIYKQQKGKCYYCKIKLNGIYDVDHIVPISRGGHNDPSNLVISCSRCNTSKGSKLLHEWSKNGLLI